jgi:hypothetical protein
LAYDVGIRNAKQVGGFGVGDVLGDVLGFGGVDAVGVPDGVAVGDRGGGGGGGGGGHFDDDASVRAPSRLPKTIGADSTDRIGAR